jgi:D-ribose pyranase
VKKHGVLQPELAQVIAMLGHTDSIVIADAGLPIPSEVKRIDLAVTNGVPRFMQVLGAVLDDVQVERVVIAREMRETSPQLHRELIALLGSIPIEEVSHAEFKAKTRNARAIVRTGEFTPYANIILFSGVVF